jgi:hypothetical protein
LTKVVEKITTHILCSIIFFSENCTVYEIIPKNIMKTERSHMTSQYGRIRVTCWISKATCTYAHAHAYARKHAQISNTYCFPTAKVIRERASTLRCTYIACIVIIFFLVFLVTHDKGWQTLVKKTIYHVVQIFDSSMMFRRVDFSGQHIGLLFRDLGMLDP